MRIRGGHWGCSWRKGSGLNRQVSMPFSFLNPWFWLGALAVAAPVWLHLRRKRETNVVEFTALRFLDDQPEPRRSPWRLRDLLLFAMRVLALLLLVAAFAWPYLRGANTAPV